MIVLRKGQKVNMVNKAMLGSIKIYGVSLKHFFCGRPSGADFLPFAIVFFSLRLFSIEVYQDRYVAFI